jgi:hypothetical protein
VSISPSYSLAKVPHESGKPGKICVMGRAVPYYPPPPQTSEKAGGPGGPTSSWNSKSSAVPPDPEKEVRECKEMAIKLLMGRCDEMVHEVLNGNGGIVEVLDGKAWKYGQPRGERVVEKREGSDSVRKLENVNVKGKKDSWFSK